MKIKPGIGLDKLKFGMTEDQVIELIGEPSLIIIDEDGEKPKWPE